MNDHASTSVSPPIPQGKANTHLYFLYMQDAYKSLQNSYNKAYFIIKAR